MLAADRWHPLEGQRRSIQTSYSLSLDAIVVPWTLRLWSPPRRVQMDGRRAVAQAVPGSVRSSERSSEQPGPYFHFVRLFSENQRRFSRLGLRYQQQQQQQQQHGQYRRNSSSSGSAVRRAEADRGEGETGYTG
ncbi:hypothetical protein EYF80_034105 [Liparis tanakae]|uniref:Uncharacterized protein n=1 Tax=Liparis tanakae TaxID=230148 RepID=A0A4Z2GR01_9TELE|nr:hypothetical protein EYF80_034105 [Liparis tanakae]